LARTIKKKAGKQSRGTGTAGNQKNTRKQKPTEKTQTMKPFLAREESGGKIERLKFPSSKGDKVRGNHRETRKKKRGITMTCAVHFKPNHLGQKALLQNSTKPNKRHCGKRMVGQ